MSKYKFQEKEFSSKAEMFKHIKASKDILIKQKTSEVYLSKDKDPNLVVKTIDPSQIKGDATKIDLSNDFYYVAVNSTNVLDSHGDLHVDGIWNKTIKEQQGKLYLVLDHELKFQSVVTKKEDIEVFTATVPFSSIGKSYAGRTEILVYKFRKDKVVNKLAKEWLEGDNDIQASVRMQYVKIELAIDSDAKEDIAEKATFDSYIGKIANKADCGEIDYFWVVKEARNVSESSLVLFGSNGSTGLIRETKSKLADHLESLKEAINEETNDNQKILLNLQLETMKAIIDKKSSTTQTEPEQKDTSNSIYDLWD